MSTGLYMVVGKVTGCPISFGGRILTHDNPRELAFLLTGGRIMEVPREFTDKEWTMSIKQHPDFAHLRYPLDPRQFRTRS